MLWDTGEEGKLLMDSLSFVCFQYRIIVSISSRVSRQNLFCRGVYAIMCPAVPCSYSSIHEGLLISFGFAFYRDTKSP